MLDKLGLIASAISALTAATTSLRALGKSRENARFEMEEKIKTGCRVEDYNETPPKNSNLMLHFAVTLIWFALSIIFALPLLSRKFSDKGFSELLLWISPFILIALVCGIIWWQTLNTRN